MLDDTERVAEQIVEVLPYLLRKVSIDLRCCDPGTVPSHFRLLESLAVDSLTLSELAEREGVSLATMSNTVATLVDRGWIERVQHSIDRRKVHLALSPAGKEMSRQIYQRLEQSVAQLIRDLPDEDLNNLMNGFQTLRRVLEHAGYMIGDGSASVKNEVEPSAVD
jgi:DNA-binding MarR family transcriptional regulator